MQIFKRLKAELASKTTAKATPKPLPKFSITQLESMFLADQRASELSIQEYKEAKTYYHGNQLPLEIYHEIRARGQMPLVENIYKMIVDKILGYKTQSLQEIKVSGRQEEDKPLANLLNDILKVFSQQNNFDKEIIKRDKDLMFGMAVCELWVKKDGKDKIIDIKTLPADSFLIDKYSTDKNAQDARRFHKITNIDEAQARALFGENILLEKATNSDENRAEVVESWIYESYTNEKGERKNAWNRYIWKKSQLLSYEISPFKNGENPFIIAKYNIDENNQWYGMFRDIKPLQDYINFAENKIINMMGSFKVFVEEGSFNNIDEFKRQAGSDNAVVFLREGSLKEKRLEFVQHHAAINELSQKTAEKRNLAKILSGLNDEALGVAINRQSGVAISQRREAGLMGLQDFIKSGDDMDRLIFEKALDFITHYFDTEQVFRIVDKKVGERFFAINTDESNQIKIGKFDLIFKTTLKAEGREERFTHWAEMMKTFGQVQPELLQGMLPLMLKDTESPIVADVEELLAQVEQSKQEAAKANAPLEQKQAELNLAQLEARIAELEAKAAKNQAQAELIATNAQNLAQNPQSPQNPSQNPAQNPQSPLAKNDDKGGASISTGEKAGLSGGQVALKQSAGSYGKIDMR
ncbi:portal protein [Helicobacter sp. T3_23-1056]